MALLTQSLVYTELNAIYNILLSLNQLSFYAVSVLLCRMGGWRKFFLRVHWLDGVSAVRTKVSMGDLVVETPLFNVASSILHPSSSSFMCAPIATG